MKKLLSRLLSVITRSERTRFLSFIVIFAVVGTGTVFFSSADTISVWQTGFESTDIQPSYRDTIDWSTNIGGYYDSIKPEASVRQESVHSGTHALMYSGTDLSSSDSYANYKLFDVSIPVTSDTQLSYWIYPQSANARCAGIDLQFSDGTSLRNTADVDQNGFNLHPRTCHGGNIPINQWSNVRSDIGKLHAGATITKMWMAYDQPANTGQYRGYIDDLAINRTSALFIPDATGVYTAKFWNYTDTPTLPISNLAYQTTTTDISYDWSTNTISPSVNHDRYVAQFTKNQLFDGGTYNFSVTADDGVRVFVDDQVVINQWHDQAPTTYNASKVLAAGSHDIRVEYYQNTGGAVLNFNYSKTQLPPVPAPAPTPAPVPAPVISGYPLYNTSFFNDLRNDPAAAQATAWQSTRPADALQMQKIISQPQASWLGDWSGNSQNATDNVVSAASAQRSAPVLIAYDIPFRDCNGYSSGGASSYDAYISFITGMANGINGRKTVVILEPDALGLITCLSPTDQMARYNMLSQAVQILKSKGALVYIEASTWISPTEMADRLGKAGVANATGFAVNVSGFNKTSDMVSYGNTLSTLVGGKHFVIDTSRNGLGPNGEWCNPLGRALGDKTTTFSSGSVDAYLWLKRPGESDGTCNGGPPAGQWWADYALNLAQRANY